VFRSKLLSIHPTHVLRPFYAIFGLTPYGMLRSITLNPYVLHYFYADIFDLRLLYLRPTFV